MYQHQINETLKSLNVTIEELKKTSHMLEARITPDDINHSFVDQNRDLELQVIDLKKLVETGSLKNRALLQENQALKEKLNKAEFEITQLKEMNQQATEECYKYQGLLH